MAAMSMALRSAPDARLATTSYDGHVRLYGADGRLARKAKAPGGAAALRHRLLARRHAARRGYNDTTRVDVLSAQTLGHLLSPDTSGVDNGNLSRVAWLADGTRLAAAGKYPVER